MRIVGKFSHGHMTCSEVEWGGVGVFVGKGTVGNFPRSRDLSRGGSNGGRRGGGASVGISHGQKGAWLKGNKSFKVTEAALYSLSHVLT